MGFINKEAFFPTAMVLFGALAPPRQILLHCWGWSLVPLPRKAENNAHFRSSGDMKLGECCTKLGGDTNLSWGLPASTKIAAPPRHKTLRSFCGTRGGFTTRPGFCLEFVSLQLLFLQWISWFFWGKRKIKPMHKNRQSLFGFCCEPASPQMQHWTNRNQPRKIKVAEWTFVYKRSWDPRLSLVPNNLFVSSCFRE